MPPSRIMTPFKFQVLTFIENFYTKNRYSPTYREIIKGVGRGSTSQVAWAMESLAKDGFLTEGVEGQARTQVPTFKQKPELYETTEDEDDEEYEY